MKVVAFAARGRRAVRRARRALWSTVRRPGPAETDLSQPRFTRDPWPHWEKLRRQGPVHYMARHDFWLVLGYAEVKAAFEQPRLFSNAPYADVDAVLLAADPPRHAEVRKLVSRHFSAEALDRLTAAATRAAEALIRPEMDVVSGYGLPISQAVAAELIGFEPAEVEAIVSAERETQAAPDPLAAFIVELDRLAPRSALFGRLRADAAGSLADAELASLIRLLWLAATTTTERVITRSILRLLEHPEVRRAVTDDRALLPALAEEVMRLHPPEHMVPRRTRAPATLGGAAIPEGALVYLCVAAAHRDPAEFEAPDELRLERASKRHFAFGRGIHLCVGAPLTRRLVPSAVGLLFERAPAFRALQPLDSIDYFHTMTALTPSRLVIATEPR